MKNLFISLFLNFSFFIAAFSQSPQPSTLNDLREEFSELVKAQDKIKDKIEILELEGYSNEIRDNMLPEPRMEENIISHSGLWLEYDENHEQARWVSHIISPKILSGFIPRSNEFLVDSLVKTGSSEELDYFLKTQNEEGKYSYDGFGYDRGHLAPAADFRWSQKAVIESFYYSNMSPQLPDFNRGIWADLEGIIRAYISSNPEVHLYVTTGPFLKTSLKKITRSKNGVSIPERFFKAVVDPINNRGIAFILPNKKSESPIQSFAFTIDQLEKELKLDLFSGLNSEKEKIVEADSIFDDWLPANQKGNVKPLPMGSLPKNHFNTSAAKKHMAIKGKISVCGKVVGARKSQKGNILLNLDQKYPNQAFTVFIKKEDIINFSFDPLTTLTGKTICVTGEVINQGGPTMYIRKEEKLKLLSEMK